MEKLLLDLESIVDLSKEETEHIIEVFKQFIHRKFYIDPSSLEDAFHINETFVLNQQDDEDDVHAHLGALTIA